jgi:hypothetical protein
MENLATISFSAVLVVDSGAAPKSVQLVSFIAGPCWRTKATQQQNRQLFINRRAEHVPI